MREFKYTIRDEAGLKHQGIRKAVCQQDVLLWMRDNDFIPISVQEAAVQRKAKTASHRSVGNTNIANFCWQLATMMEGGISITESLDTIADDMDNIRFSMIIRKLSDSIRSGQSLSESIAQYPNVFDKLFYGMVLAGESSGSMPVILRRLANYYDSRDKLIKKVKGAMAYPIFVIGFIIVIVTVMAVFIIPRFRAIFNSIQGKMPAFTESYLAVYDFFKTNAIFVFPALLLMIFVLIWYSKTRPGHEKVSRFTLSLPLFGSIILHAFMALFCRTTAALLSAGVSVLDSFEILGGMAKNDVIKDGMFVTRENVVKGSSISASMASAGIFPNLVLKMVKVGEQAGTLPEVLERTADYYERKVEALISTMTKMLEPILIIIVGMIVLVTVIALYLPIFSMSDI